MTYSSDPAQNPPGQNPSGQNPYGQNPYGQNPYGGAQPGSTPQNPGKNLGIIGLVLGIIGFVVAFIAPIAGVIVSILGLNKSKQAGQKNGLAMAGLIVSIVAFIANILFTVAIIGLFTTFGGAAMDIFEQCQANPNGVVEFQGQQVPCDQLLGEQPTP